jgi:hypothetical protein
MFELKYIKNYSLEPQIKIREFSNILSYNTKHFECLILFAITYSENYGSVFNRYLPKIF